MDKGFEFTAVDYYPPIVEIIEVEVEKGFSASFSIENLTEEEQEW